MSRKIGFKAVLMSVCLVTFLSGPVFTVSAQKKGNDVSEMTTEEMQKRLIELERKVQELEKDRVKTTGAQKETELIIKGAAQKTTGEYNSGKRKDISQMTDEEKRQRLQELEHKRQELEQKRNNIPQMTDGRKGADLNTIISRYENMLERCAYTNKSDRCADVMYTLGALYYDQSKDDYAKAVERFAEESKTYEKTGRGAAPVHPIPDYSKSMQMYWQLTREYPTYSKLHEAFFQMSTTYLLAGHLDTTKLILETLVNRFPGSPRVSAVHFRLGDLAFVDNNYNRAYNHFRKVRRNEVDLTSWEMTHYRLGECAYNIGDFDKAVEYFNGYVEECDAGKYQKKEFREEALEYMATAFSDMPNGVDEAIKFFNKRKGKPYETQVIYMVGEENWNRGQWDAAISALEGALKKYPLYKEAPLARECLISCYVMKKEYQKANAERESLISDYGVGSTWYQANPNEIDKAKFIIDKAKKHNIKTLKDAYKIGRSRRGIRRVVNQNVTTLKYAYDKRVREKPALEGTITVKFAIDEFGKVIFAKVVESKSTINDPEFEKTVVDIVRSWIFEKIDKPDDVTEVTYPFAFSP